jgi:NifU-like protein involved in Fe-S cluster formation
MAARRIPRNAWRPGGLHAACDARPYRRTVSHLYNRLQLLRNQDTATGPMLNDVYNARILELAGNIPRLGRLSDPDASATAHSKLCGSTVTVDLKMQGDTVTDFAHDVKACALGQASSSIMARHVVGAKAADLRALRDTVRKMLKDNGTPPKDGEWADIAVLEPVRDFKARHASTMLTFDAVVSAIDQIEAKRKASAAAS